MTTRLHIGDQQTTVDVDLGTGQRDAVVLAIGSSALAHRHFRSELPTAAELEAAIDTVEDVLMPLIPRLRGAGSLLTSDDESIALAASACLPTNTTVELDTASVERQFNRLVDVVNGRPVSHEGLPTRARFAAHLLILRELMHHADRRSVTVAPATHQEAAPHGQLK